MQVVIYEIHELGVLWSLLRIEMGPNDVKHVVSVLCEPFLYLIRFFNTNSYFILYTGCNLRNTRTGSAMESIDDINGPEHDTKCVVWDLGEFYFILLLSFDTN